MTFKIAMSSIAANKFRAVLTVLGIVIGVASVIAMLALGEGTKKQITESFRAFGANLITIRPAGRGWGGGGAVRQAEYQTLRVEHAEAILREVPEVDMVTPDLDGSYQVKYEAVNRRLQINGCAPTYFVMRNFPIEKGRHFNDEEVRRMTKVAVVGPKMADEFFLGQDPLGKELKIAGKNYIVIGVTKSKDDRSDDNIWIPYTTAMSQLMGQEHIDQIYVRARDEKSVAAAMENVKAVMRKQLRVQAGAQDPFTAWNNTEIVEQMERTAAMFTILLGGVAAISLLVGGVNIMNIMLVSVTERTREIGVRKALGARARDLMAQFLAESVTVSLVGGIMGVAVGVGIVAAFNNITARFNGNPFGAEVTATPVIAAFCVSVAIGIFFGWYPAKRASQLDPIEALRYE